MTVLHAGSLSAPMAKMASAFAAAHPKVDIRREGGGSAELVRMISELGRPADIMISADHAVIDTHLIPDFAAVNIIFAGNQMVLCHTPGSKFAKEITGDNWHEILCRPGVAWSHSDPELDPCGYRSLMVLQLAEIVYDMPGLYQDLMATRPEGNIRPMPAELMALLKSGSLDYAWEYLSVAVQHGLEYVPLDARINLSDPACDDFYAQAKVEVRGKGPGGAVTHVGASITYGAALLKDAPNRDAAAAFLAYMLDPRGGLQILRELGQPPFIPARVSSPEMLDALPAALKLFVERK